MANYFDDSEAPTTIPVRAILATLFTVTVCVGFMIGKLSSEAFITMASLAIGWYFAKRATADEDPGDSGNGNGTAGKTTNHGPSTTYKFPTATGVAVASPQPPKSQPVTPTRSAE